MFDTTYLVDTDLLLEKNIITDKLGFDPEEIKSKIKENKISGTEIKSKITKAIAHSPDSLSSELPTVMDIIFYTITWGVPLAISPLIGIPVMIATTVIRDSADAKVIGHYISDYNLQIERVNKKIESEENEEKKKFWKKTKENLEEGRKNLILKKEALRDLNQDGDLETIDNIKECANLLEKEYYYMSMSERSEFYIGCVEDKILSEGTITDIKQTAKNVKKTISDKQDAMDKWFDDALKDIRNTSRDNVRNGMVEDSFPKLSKMIRRAIVIGGAFAINPAIAAITVLVQIVTSKVGTEKERSRLLIELNRELEIVEEKIKDADSSSDRKQKYELMRLRQKLQTDIDRIKKYI